MATVTAKDGRQIRFRLATICTAAEFGELRMLFQKVLSVDSA